MCYLPPTYAQNLEIQIKKLLNYNSNNYELNLQQIDSAIKLAEKLNDKSILSESYFTKAAYIYNQKNYNEALKYFIKANQTAKGLDDLHYYSSLFGIASIKQQLGDFKDSIEILEKCLKYFESTKNSLNNKNAYLVTLGRLTYINIKIGNNNKARYYSQLEFKNAENKYDSAYAYKNLGILEYKYHNYNKAIEHLDKALPIIKTNKDKSWLMSILHYKGESYLALGKNKLANQNYSQVIKEYNQSKIVNNDIRMSFERLLNHYKNINDKENELRIINNLLQYDSVFFNTNQTIAHSYFKDYVNSNLIEQHSKLSNEIKYSKSIIIGLILISTIIILIIVIKNRFDKLKLLKYINSITMNKTQISMVENFDVIEFDESIELRLKTFEENLEFLNTNLTLDDLVLIMDTNRSLASRYINQTRNKNFNQFINSLRIQYIIEELINNKKIRSLTIDALAEKSGFNSRKTFSDAFLKHTGFRPSYFVKNLK